MSHQTVRVVCQSCGSGVRSYREREHCMNCDRLLLPHLRPLSESEARSWAARQMQLRQAHSLPTDATVEEALLEWAQHADRPTQDPMSSDSSGCVAALIVVAVGLILLLIWYSSWSCGPGKGKCSFVSMASNTALSVQMYPWTGATRSRPLPTREAAPTPDRPYPAICVRPYVPLSAGALRRWTRDASSCRGW